MKYLIHISAIHYKAKPLGVLSLVDPHGWMVVTTGGFFNKLALNSTYILDNNGAVIKSPLPEGVRLDLKTFCRVRFNVLVSEFKEHIGVGDTIDAARELFNTMHHHHESMMTLLQCEPSMSTMSDARKFLEDNYTIGASEFTKKYDATDRQIESYNKSREVRTSVVKENAALREHIHNLNTAAANALADMAVLLREQKPNWEDGSFNVDGQSAAELHAAINKPLNIDGDIYKQVAEKLTQNLCDAYQVPRRLMGVDASVIIEDKKYV